MKPVAQRQTKVAGANFAAKAKDWAAVLEELLTGEALKRSWAKRYHAGPLGAPGGSA